MRVLVLDEAGAALAGAAVRVTSDEGAASAAEARHLTDAAGRAVAEGLPAGAAWVFVALEGYARASRSLTVHPDSGADVEVPLARQVRIRGRVELSSGAPAQDVPVGVLPGGSAEGRTVLQMGRHEPAWRTRSDADGAFELLLEPGRLVTLVARREPHAEAQLALLAAAARDDLRLVLGPGAVLTGLVRSPDGQADASAQVFVVPADVPDLVANPWAVLGAGGKVWGPLGEEVEASSEVETEGPIHRAWRARVDADGRYRVAGLPVPGRYRVLAEGRDQARGGSEVVELAPPGGTSSVDVALTARHVLHVRVVARDGQALRATGGLRGAREHFLEPVCPRLATAAASSRMR